MSRPGFTVWLTGLPLSGKSTLGRMLAQTLRERGLGAVHLAEAELRRRLGPEPEPGAAERQAASEAARVVQAGEACVVSLMAPSAAARRQARAALGEYVEVFLDCPLEQLINRDAQGRYARALAQGDQELISLGGPYEPPADPEVRCPTGAEAPGESLGRILAYLAEAGLINRVEAEVTEAEAREVYSDEEEAEVVARLKDLGYL
jgi:adenylylsulfate kinase